MKVSICLNHINSIQFFFETCQLHLNSAKSFFKLITKYPSLTEEANKIIVIDDVLSQLNMLRSLIKNDDLFKIHKRSLHQYLKNKIESINSIIEVLIYGTVLQNIFKKCSINHNAEISSFEKQFEHRRTSDLGFLPTDPSSEEQAAHYLNEQKLTIEFKNKLITILQLYSLEMEKCYEN